MHGPAVASIAVGATVGVAPEADLYYIAQWNGDWEDGKLTWNFEYLARGVRRILQINEQLPKDKKIRVISMSVGWHPSQKGYDQITDATHEAKKQGMLVIGSSVDQVHGFGFHGLGRASSANPDEFDSYEPGSWWPKMFYADNKFHAGLDRLLVPMDSRTTAAPTGADQYVFYRQAGWSWAIPYIAGAYALAAQVEPDITPDRFWALAMKTGRTIMLNHNDKQLPFGPILDPIRLLEATKAGELTDKDSVAAELAKYRVTDRSTPTVSAIKDINAKVAELNIDRAAAQDVVRILGEPTKHMWPGQTFEKDNLPDSYAMFYNNDLSVNVRKGRVVQLGFHTPGYIHKDAIQFGSLVPTLMTQARSAYVPTSRLFASSTASLSAFGHLLLGSHGSMLQRKSSNPILFPSGG